MSAPIEIDWQTRQQIAFWAGVFGAIAALILASGNTGEHQPNPLVVGFISFVVSSVISLMNKGLGGIIIVASSLIILRSCS